MPVMLTILIKRVTHGFQSYILEHGSNMSGFTTLLFQSLHKSRKACALAAQHKHDQSDDIEGRSWHHVQNPGGLRWSGLGLCDTAKNETGEDGHHNRAFDHKTPTEKSHMLQIVKIRTLQRAEQAHHVLCQRLDRDPGLPAQSLGRSDLQTPAQMAQTDPPPSYHQRSVHMGQTAHPAVLQKERRGRRAHRDQ